MNNDNLFILLVNYLIEKFRQIPGKRQIKKCVVSFHQIIYLISFDMVLCFTKTDHFIAKMLSKFNLDKF